MKRKEALLAKKAAGTITADEQKELDTLEAAPATLDDVKDAVASSIKGAVAEAIKPLAEKISGPAVLPSGTVDGKEKRSFREILVGIKTKNARLIDKYALVPEHKFYDDVDKKALSEGTPAAGGFLVPTEQSNQIINLVNETSIIRKLARIWPMKSNTLTVPVVSNGATAYWIDEASLKTPADPTFAQMVLTAYKLCCLTVVSDELLADSNPKVDQVLTELFALAIMRGEETAFASGTGLAGNPITGIYNFAGISTVPYSGTLFDDIADLIGAVEENNGENVAVLHALREKRKMRKIKDDDGQYIYQMPADKNTPASVFDAAAYGDKYIPTNLGAGANESFMLAGDFSHAHIGDREGIVIAVDGSRYFEYDQTAFRAVKRTGFRLSDASKFARLTGIV